MEKRKHTRTRFNRFGHLNQQSTPGLANSNIDSKKAKFFRIKDSKRNYIGTLLFHSNGTVEVYGGELVITEDDVF